MKIGFQLRLVWQLKAIIDLKLGKLKTVINFMLSHWSYFDKTFIEMFLEWPSTKHNISSQCSFSLVATPLGRNAMCLLEDHSRNISISTGRPIAVTLD